MKRVLLALFILPLCGVLAQDDADPDDDVVWADEPPPSDSAIVENAPVDETTLTSDEPSPEPPANDESVPADAIEVVENGPVGDSQIPSDDAGTSDPNVDSTDMAAAVPVVDNASLPPDFPDNTPSDDTIATAVTPQTNETPPPAATTVTDGDGIRTIVSVSGATTTTTQITFEDVNPRIQNTVVVGSNGVSSGWGLSSSATLQTKNIALDALSVDEWGQWTVTETWGERTYSAVQWADWMYGDVVWTSSSAASPVWGEWTSGATVWGEWAPGSIDWESWIAGITTWSDWTSSAPAWSAWTSGTPVRTDTSATAWSPDSATAPAGTPIIQTRVVEFTERTARTRSGQVTQQRTGQQAQSRIGTRSSHRAGTTTRDRTGTVTVTWNGQLAATRAGTVTWTQTGTRSWSRSGVRSWSDGRSETLSESFVETITASGTETVAEAGAVPVAETTATDIRESTTQPVEETRTEAVTEQQVVSVTESQTTSVTDSDVAVNSGSETQSRSVTGTGDTWTAFDELVRDWYPTSAWSPLPATVPHGDLYSQSRSEAQDRRRGERLADGTERNVEPYTLLRTVTQTAVGTLAYSLLTAAAGPGTVTAGGSYRPNSLLTVSAVPLNGRFIGWAGDASGSATSVLVVMDRDKAVTGIFAAKLDQAINLSVPPIVRLGAGAAAIPLTAVASSGLAVSLQVVSGPATLVGSILNLNGEGAVVIQATQAGDATYAAAPPVQRTINGVAGAGLKQTTHAAKIQQETGGSNLVRTR